MDFVDLLVGRANELAAGLVRALPQIAIALIVLIITWVAAKAARRILEQLMRRAELRATLLNLFETILGVLIWTGGLLIAATIVLPGVTPGNLIALLGLGSVAIGFAFKDIFENFLAGILIMLRKKVNIGDVIECESVQGRVEQITLRDTYLRHLSNELVLVPNAYLFKNPLKILTDAPLRRHEVEVGVPYSVNLDEAAAVIRESVTATETVDQRRPVEVFAKDFGDSSIDFLVRWWSGSTPVEAHISRDQVVRAIKRALDDAGIEIPFPQRTLWFQNSPQLAHDAKQASD
ncbi:MAG: mechanosensitive ion channel family protein [Sphingomicrobium sp.]